MDNKKIIVVLLVGVAAFLILRNKEKQTVTQNYSKAEGLTSAAGGFAAQLNDIAQNAINNATEQVTNLGDKIAEWRLYRYNNASDKMIW